MKKETSRICVYFTLLYIVIFVCYIADNKIRTRHRIRGHTPAYIIQYGLGGSATTLQFQILCVLMALIHEDEANNVGCYYAKQPMHKYCVIKTHYIKDTLLYMVPSDTWFFMTSSRTFTYEKINEVETNKRNIENMKFKIPSIVDVEIVSKRGHTIIIDYYQYFDLSDSQKEHALQYIRYWDILRLCCGKQMSADWRKYLTPSATYKQHHEKNSSAYPACEMYNISEVEKLLMQTYVYQHFAHIPTLSEIIGKPSNVDGQLDGTYCERCNKNIALKGLHFNEDCK